MMSKTVMGYDTVVELADILSKYVIRLEGPNGQKVCKYREGYVDGEQVDDRIMTQIASDRLGKKLTVANVRNLRSRVFGELYRPEPEKVSGAVAQDTLKKIWEKLETLDEAVSSLYEQLGVSVAGNKRDKTRSIDPGLA